MNRDKLTFIMQKRYVSRVMIKSTLNKNKQKKACKINLKSTRNSVLRTVQCEQVQTSLFSGDCCVQTRSSRNAPNQTKLFYFTGD